MYNKETVIRLNTLDDVQEFVSNIDRFLLMRNHFLE